MDNNNINKVKPYKSMHPFPQFTYVLHFPQNSQTKTLIGISEA